QLDRQGAERTLGQVTGTRLAVLVSKAADCRQDGHGTSFLSLQGSIECPPTGLSAPPFQVRFRLDRGWALEGVWGPRLLSMPLTMGIKRRSIKRNEVMVWINEIEMRNR